MDLMTYKFLTSRKWCLGQLKSLRATMTPSIFFFFFFFLEEKRGGGKNEGRELGEGVKREREVEFCLMNHEKVVEGK